MDKANNRCEWCGIKLEAGLTVHHNNHIDYYGIWCDIINEYLEEINEKNEEWKSEWDKAWRKDSFNEMINKVKNEIDKEAKSSKVEACPYCDSSQLSKRKEKRPKYYCSKCKKEFGSENPFCSSCFPLINKFESDPRVNIDWNNVYNGFR